MPPPFCRKTSFCPARSGNDAASRAPCRAGSATLAVVLLFFLFSGLGLGLVLLADGFQRMSRSRRDALRLECAAENGVKQGLARLAPAPALGSAATIEDNHLMALGEDAAAGGIRAAEEAMNIFFPLLETGSESGLSWSATAGCGLRRFARAGEQFEAEYLVSIEARGRIPGWRPEASAGLDLGLSVLAGRVPLAYFPLLLAGTEANESAAGLFEEGRVSLVPLSRADLAARALVTPRPLVPADASPLLAEVLKIRLLEPGGIRLDILRQALGLPVVDEPVPDGVYLIQSDAGLGGIFVQGDLDRLLLAVEGDRQVIGFESQTGVWKLAFVPGLGPTDFAAPTGSTTDNHVPLGIILVNGAVGSLSAAMPDGAGGLEASPEPGLPSLKDGQSLTIVSSHELVIDSDLLPEGVRWAGSIPYLRDKPSQLVVYAGNRDLLDGSETGGSIKIGSRAPNRVRIHGSLAASGGLSVEGQAKEIFIGGGVQAASLRLGSSTLAVSPDERIAQGTLAPAPGPAAAEPVLKVLRLRPLAWREGK